MNYQKSIGDQGSTPNKANDSSSKLNLFIMISIGEDRPFTKRKWEDLEHSEETKERRYSWI
jgi:hypothetical protein